MFFNGAVLGNLKDPLDPLNLKIQHNTPGICLSLRLTTGLESFIIITQKSLPDGIVKSKSIKSSKMALKRLFFDFSQNPFTGML